MSPKKPNRKKKKNKPKMKAKTKQKPKLKAKGTAKGKGKLEDLSLTARRVTAALDDPIGACQFTNSSGQLSCVDNITKSECAKLKNSIFLVGESCQ
jgi:hypothetical protein